MDIGGTSDQFNFASQECGCRRSHRRPRQQACKTPTRLPVGQKPVLCFAMIQLPELPMSAWFHRRGKVSNSNSAAAAAPALLARKSRGFRLPFGSKWSVPATCSADITALDGHKLGASRQHTQTILMSGTALAGLGTTAHNNSALNHCTLTNVSVPATTFGIYRQYWTNLSQSVGDSLDALTNTTDNPNWPNRSGHRQHAHIYNFRKPKLTPG